MIQFAEQTIHVRGSVAATENTNNAQNVFNNLFETSRLILHIRDEQRDETGRNVVIDRIERLDEACAAGRIRNDSLGGTENVERILFVAAQKDGRQLVHWSQNDHWDGIVFGGQR